jgi:hypothetical protein
MVTPSMPVWMPRMEFAELLLSKLTGVLNELRSTLGFSQHAKANWLVTPRLRALMYSCPSAEMRTATIRCPSS